MSRGHETDWLREEFARARERRAQVPNHARPTPVRDIDLTGATRQPEPVEVTREGCTDMLSALRDKARRD